MVEYKTTHGRLFKKLKKKKKSNLDNIKRVYSNSKIKKIFLKKNLPKKLNKVSILKKKWYFKRNGVYGNRSSVLKALTGVIYSGFKKKNKEVRVKRINNVKYPMITNLIKLGLKDVNLRIVTNANIQNFYYNIVTKIKTLINRLPRRLKSSISTNKFVFGILTTLLFRDAATFSNLIKSLFQKFKGPTLLRVYRTLKSI